MGKTDSGRGHKGGRKPFVPGGWGRRNGIDIQALAGEVELLSPRDLPALTGREVFLDWDFDDGEPGDQVAWNVVRHNGAEVFREVATADGFIRYRQVKTILRRRYGRRFKALRPSRASLIHLHGDRRL